MHKLKRLKRITAISIIVVLVLVTACVKNPVTGQDEFSLMSVPEELSLGKELYPKYTQQSNGLPANDPGLQSYVNRVGHWVAKNSHRPDIPWEFNVVNSSEINAYALPGGKISITRGLINKFDNEDQLAFVLGHEVGHVAARHSAAHYTKGVVASIVVAGVGVALGGSEYRELGEMAAILGGAILLASYSRDQERQADSLGLEYITKAGYNPTAAADVQEILLSLQKREPNLVETLFASHPLSSERLQNVKDETANEYGWATARMEKKEPFVRATALQARRKSAYKAMDNGDKLFTKGNYSLAAAHYKKAADAFPQEGLFKARLAKAELKMGRKGDALMHAKQGARLRPDLFETHMILGATYQVNNLYKKATYEHQRSDNLLPTALNSYMMATAYDKMGQSSNASRQYQRVMQMAPNSQLGRASKVRLMQLR